MFSLITLVFAAALTFFAKVYIFVKSSAAIILYKIFIGIFHKPYYFLTFSCLIKINENMWKDRTQQIDQLTNKFTERYLENHNIDDRGQN